MTSISPIGAVSQIRQPVRRHFVLFGILLYIASVHIYNIVLFTMQTQWNDIQTYNCFVL